ncbi:16S rRNA (uracil(1498)-N(3))-methyltransferase [candidate division KSB1 bacterium]|nr:16S rRNA (uracil(1498)-N(3))-methyltransferase [candidate division KSB1 bacterium]
MHHLEYFYVPSTEISGDELFIRGSELKHLASVMRKKRGDIVQVTDGHGLLYTVMIAEISKQQVTCFIQKKSRFRNEPMLHLSLASGIPKSGRFDWIIEKGTEIGVSAFYPLITDRSVNKGSDGKQKRWQNVAVAAMKQSTRCVLPEIAQPQTVQDFLAKPTTYDYQLIAHPGEGVEHLSKITLDLKQKAARVTSIKKAVILIGPEGGFTVDELQSAQSLHYHQFSLGDRRLRTETATIVSAAIVMELINNLT